VKIVSEVVKTRPLRRTVTPPIIIDLKIKIA
jgi:hypothetical protein